MCDGIFKINRDFSRGAYFKKTDRWDGIGYRFCNFAVVFRGFKSSPPETLVFPLPQTELQYGNKEEREEGGQRERALWRPAVAAFVTRW